MSRSRDVSGCLERRVQRLVERRAGGRPVVEDRHGDARLLVEALSHRLVRAFVVPQGEQLILTDRAEVRRLVVQEPVLEITAARAGGVGALLVHPHLQLGEVKRREDHDRRTPRLRVAIVMGSGRRRRQNCRHAHCHHSRTPHQSSVTSHGPDANCTRRWLVTDPYAWVTTQAALFPFDRARRARWQRDRAHQRAAVLHPDRRCRGERAGRWNNRHRSRSSRRAWRRIAGSASSNSLQREAVEPVASRIAFTARRAASLAAFHRRQIRGRPDVVGGQHQVGDPRRRLRPVAPRSGGVDQQWLEIGRLGRVGELDRGIEEPGTHS